MACGWWAAKSVGGIGSHVTLVLNCLTPDYLRF